MTFRHKKDGGALEFNWGNVFGVSRTCNVCLKIFILPTAFQLRQRPQLKREFRGIEIE